MFASVWTSECLSPWSSLVEVMKDVLAQVISCCVNDRSKKIMQHIHVIIPYMFDFGADPMDHRVFLFATREQRKKGK